MVQGQIEAYRLETGNTPSTVNELVPEYLQENQVKCKDGTDIIINDGVASIGA